MHVEPLFAAPFAHWPLFIAIPLFGALLGFLVSLGTNRLRLAAAALPGSARRHRHRLAALHGKLVADGVLSAQELFARVDPHRLATEVEKPLLRMVDEMVLETATRYRPGLWELLPLRVKQLITAQVHGQACEMVAELVDEVSVDAAEVCDIEQLVRARLDSDPELLSRLTATINEPVHAAAMRLAALLGLLLGALAVLIIGWTGSLLALPVAGLLTGLGGYLLAPWWTRRRFAAARTEVATGYADLLAAEILNFAALVGEVTEGSRANRFTELVRKLVHRRIDGQLSAAKPLVVAGLGPRQYQDLKQDVSTKVIERIPAILRPAEKYVTSTMDVRNTVGHRVRTMPQVRYDLLLRPTLTLDHGRIAALWTVLGALLGGIGMLLLGMG